MRIEGLKSLRAFGFSLFLLVLSSSALANEEAGSEKLDPAKIIMEHIQDSHEFHFFTIKKAPTIQSTSTSFATSKTLGCLTPALKATDLINFPK